MHPNILVVRLEELPTRIQFVQVI